ncbi:ATP-binding protein [Streptomyces sp. NPDC002688]|uniref:ATP-binding protein n=1 Tax=Streptomyces sp. NPDC002688 TaxID=3154423 RepID=UPI00332D25D0
MTRRESVALERCLRRAKFGQSATLEGFDFNASPKLPAAQIRDLAALRWLHSGETRAESRRKLVEYPLRPKGLFCT